MTSPDAGSYIQSRKNTLSIGKVIKWSVLAALSITGIVVFLLPENAIIPVQNATTKDWNQQTFWYEPWGSSGVHKGIDIFGSKGTPLLSATGGVVIFSGDVSKGGNVIAVLGPKWRIHYYAHMDSAEVSAGEWLSRGDTVGAMGVSGNAAGKPPHLHYSILTLVPYPWRWDSSTQGWKKMFYLDPGAVLQQTPT